VEERRKPFFTAEGAETAEKEKAQSIPLPFKGRGLGEGMVGTTNGEKFKSPQPPSWKGALLLPLFKVPVAGHEG